MWKKKWIENGCVSFAFKYMLNMQLGAFQNALSSTYIVTNFVSFFEEISVSE